ncbi:multicopper oxidase domain-containing protein [Lentzea sp. NPDC004789]
MDGVPGLTQDGVRADGPRKDTVLVLPGRSVEVDFRADNPGQWLAHCHNVYHGEEGMMSVVSYVERRAHMGIGPPTWY